MKPDEMLEAFTRARANVVYAETKMNKASSRSHAIFQLRISKRERVFEAAKTGQKVECTIARLNVVDLAGSERVKKILDGSIGGNCRTCLLVCVNSAFEHVGETLNTLEFASRAMRVEVDAKVNTALVEVSAKNLLADLNPEAHEFGKKVMADKKEIEALRKQSAEAAEQAKKEAEKREKAVQEAEGHVKKLQQAAHMISAPSNPLPCRPGEALVLRWQLRFSEDLAPGAQLQLRNGQAVAVIPDAVPARCCFELGLHVDAPSFEANAVQRFVFTAGEFSRDLDVVLAIRRDAEIEERRAEPHPDLGIIPGNHTRRTETMKSHAIHLPEIVTQRSQDDWALVDQTRLFPELPPSLKERFGNEASLRFWVNGKEKVVLSGQFPVTMNLAEFLRYHLGLTGTKIGCGEASGTGTGWLLV
eukprot:g2180.t1